MLLFVTKLVVVLWVVVGFWYMHGMRKLFNYTKKNNLELMGRKYFSFVWMLSDAYLIYCLTLGRLPASEDDQLNKLTSAVTRRLRISIGLGILMNLLPLLNAFAGDL